MRQNDQREQGSIAMTAIVGLMATSLILAVLLVVEGGLRSSRRAGDSANALQVADAGVNAAIKEVANAPASVNTLGPIEGDVGTGKYVFSAQRVGSTPTWNLTSTGTDRVGVQRRIMAQAEAEPLFRRPIHVESMTLVGSGSILESYSSPTARCTRNGHLSIKDPNSLSFTSSGGGSSMQNCHWITDSTASHSMDGCVIPSTEAQLSVAIPNWSNITGPGRCPNNTTLTRREAPIIPLPGVVAPPAAKRDFTVSALLCDASNPLIAKKVYVADSVTLDTGCYVSGYTAADRPSATTPPPKAVEIYSKNYAIGANGGNGSIVNPPQSPFCTGAADHYCAGWPGVLSLNVIEDGIVRVRGGLSQGHFWGSIYAPNGTFEIANNAPQATFWGASVTQNFDGKAQFTWRFDDNMLRVIGSGRYGVTRWREEPVA